MFLNATSLIGDCIPEIPQRKNEITLNIQPNDKPFSVVASTYDHSDIQAIETLKDKSKSAQRLKKSARVLRYLYELPVGLFCTAFLLAGRVFHENFTLDSDLYFGLASSLLGSVVLIRGLSSVLDYIARKIENKTKEKLAKYYNQSLELKTFIDVSDIPLSAPPLTPLVIHPTLTFSEETQRKLTDFKQHCENKEFQDSIIKWMRDVPAICFIKKIDLAEKRYQLNMPILIVFRFLNAMI